MAAQDIYLSPRNIINHLQVIEKKIPRRDFSLYSPLQNQVGIVSEENLIIEAQNMLAFVGLSWLKANVKFSELDPGVGGNIHLRAGEKEVNINVDAQNKNNWSACLAVLAHELCHKVLQVYDLTFPITTMTEVYTDLTTIYVGFGQLILDGCITHTIDSTQYLGYLKPDTYKVTHLLVCVLYGKMSGEQTGLLHTDIFAEDAINLWETNKDRNALLRRIYVNKGRQVAELRKNIALFEQLIKDCKSGLLFNAEQLEKQMYFNSGLYTNPDSNVLSAFSVIYDYCVNDKEETVVNRDPKISKLSKAFYDAIFDVFLAYKDINHFEFSSLITCPFCGNTFQDGRIEDAVGIVTCPSCRHHFIHDGTKWNPTIRQRELNEEKRIHQKHLDEEVKRAQALHLIEINKRIQELDEEKKSRQRRLNEEVINATANIRHDADIRVAEVRLNEQQRCKEAIRKQIPKLLLPFVKKYLQ